MKSLFKIRLFYFIFFCCFINNIYALTAQDIIIIEGAKAIIRNQEGKVFLDISIDNDNSKILGYSSKKCYNKYKRHITIFEAENCLHDEVTVIYNKLLKEQLKYIRHYTNYIPIISLIYNVGENGFRYIKNNNKIIKQTELYTCIKDGCNIPQKYKDLLKNGKLHGNIQDILTKQHFKSFYRKNTKYSKGWKNRRIFESYLL